MNTDEHGVWVFHGAGGRFASGVFGDRTKAEKIIGRHSLSGVLTWYPVDELAYDWGVRNQCLGMKAEKLTRLTAEDIGRITASGQPHYHYEDGNRVT